MRVVVDAPRACQAGPNAQRLPLCGAVILPDEFRILGTRSDDGHFAPENVVELGEFIDLQPAKERTEWEYPLVVAGGNCALTGPTRAHRAELVHQENAPIS